MYNDIRFWISKDIAEGVMFGVGITTILVVVLGLYGLGRAYDAVVSRWGGN